MRTLEGTLAALVLGVFTFSVYAKLETRGGEDRSARPITHREGLSKGNEVFSALAKLPKELDGKFLCEPREAKGVGFFRLVNRERLASDFRLSANASSQTEVPAIRIFFAANDDLTSQVYWLLRPGSLELFRVRAGQHTKLKEEPFKPKTGPWNFSLLRRGMYYSLQIDGQGAATIPHPSGDIIYSKSKDLSVYESRLGVDAIEPEFTRFGAEAVEGSLLLSDVKFSFGNWYPKIPQQPVLQHNQTWWTKRQVVIGAILITENAVPFQDPEGYFYMYFNGVDTSIKNIESGGRARIGVAKSKDLVRWEIGNSKQFLLEGTPGTWDETYTFVNGAVIAPDGRIAISYMGYNDREGRTWPGIGMAFAKVPEGPFSKHPKPVLTLGKLSDWNHERYSKQGESFRKKPGEWDDYHIHEHGLTRLDGRYLLTYTGFGGQVDQGGIAYSENLLQWSKDPANPVISGSGAANYVGKSKLNEHYGRYVSMWDDGHLRPRSLLKIGDYFYLFYEGSMFETFRPGKELQIWDSVGVARSRSLHGPWERHPLNPIINQRAGDHFDSMWTGWPNAVLKDNQVYIYYAAAGNEKESVRHTDIGLRVVPTETFATFSGEF